MKETRFFYTPHVDGVLPEEEARHVLKVLRLQVGDEINLMDGNGIFHCAEISLATNHRCEYRILESNVQEPAWTGHLHLAMAPTKLIDRTEWLAEKATEIGFDELSFLDCQFSERHAVKSERIDKILISAMKQSHKAWKPVLNSMQLFSSFVSKERAGDCFICHCYDESEINPSMLKKPFLLDVLQPGVPTTVLIGPEGDFSVSEVRLALQHGYRSVTLGSSRLRTETAALVAVHLMQLANQKK